MRVAGEISENEFGCRSLLLTAVVFEANNSLYRKVHFPSPTVCYVTTQPVSHSKSKTAYVEHIENRTKIETQTGRDLHGSNCQESIRHQ